LLLEQAQARGETPEDPLLLFSVLYGFILASFIAFDGELLRELASQFLALAETQGTAVPLMIGHRLMGTSLVCTGNLVQGWTHHNQAIALYDPAEQRPLTARFGQDARVAILCYRSLAGWTLGYPEAAILDAEQALRDAREIGQAATLMYALFQVSWTHFLCRNYVAAAELADENVELADQKGSFFWKAWAMLVQGCVLARTGNVSDAVPKITAALASYRSTSARLFLPSYLSHLALSYRELGQFDNAWQCIGEAITAVETTEETWFEAEVHRMAGEIVSRLPEMDEARAEAFFERFNVSRAQEAKSCELRATMSMARLWRAQGKKAAARDLLAPTYEWFTEGFDTPDLREAKALLADF
jgi:predicted ATPase